MEAKGTCANGFEAVQQAFEAIFDDPHERGGGVCIQVDGETVVDLWAGVADEQGDQPWTRDTLVNTFCTVKPFAAVATLMLVEEGKLELDVPVAHYWPEFAQGGKGQVTLRQVMTHTSGIPALRGANHNAMMYDWEHMVEILAAEPLWWEPGTAMGYATTIFGWIVGELIRRADGRDPCTFIHERISQPNDLEVHLGVDEQHFHRIAHYDAAKGRVGDPYSEALRNVLISEPEHVATLAFTNPGMVPKRTSDPRWWAYQQPAVSGQGTAHGLAGFYSALLAGRLIGPELLKEFTREHSNGMDRIWMRPMRYGLGCMMEQPADPAASLGMGPNTFGHIGLGGPISFADPDCGVSFGFVTSTSGRHSMIDPRPQELAALAYAAL
ncbi:serine hydrolase domain-containing protein [Pseudomonas sp. Fl4BN1]|uniref:serine hydrolase domain-containing protein n=1 Tax=Pseudomonas sp. Fl4BN1 TaxID=2697651 RepID=UPI001377D53E|nr:serine hydrolase domain-containing protein [Pseudomonas sp. Fl4BN1]NBF09952.1 serine hydrolase [Pseudomonas sp. Fl4BN1]